MAERLGVRVHPRQPSPAQQAAAWLVAAVQAGVQQKKFGRILVEINIADGQVKKVRTVDETTIVPDVSHPAQPDGEKSAPPADSALDALTGGGSSK